MAKEWRENDTLMTIKENNSKTNKEDSKKGVKRLKIRRFGPCTTDPCHSCIKEKKSDPCQFYSRGMRDNSDPNCNKNSKSPLPGTSREANDCTMPVDMKEERVRKTVDKLLKSFNRSDCCLRCPDQNPRLPCESFRHLLKFVESGGPTVPRVCRQSGREYEKDIVDEIKRRMRLGLCGNITAPRPALDYVAVPKKKVLRKKTPPKVEKEPKPTKKKPPKPKPKSIVPPRIVFLAPKNFKIDDTPAAAGTVQYRLSDPCFIAKGWTKLPPSRDEMYKTFYTFQAEPCGPLLDSKVWKTKQSFRFYPNGQLMARIERDGTIQVFYPNCDNDLAIHVKPSGPVHYRVVVYFNKDEYLKDRRNQLPNKSLPAAIFDSYGNGVVYDTKGKIRLKYDQAEGKLLDFPPSKACCPLQPVIHPPLHWRWQNFQQVALKRQLLHHQSHGCPNILSTYPSFKKFLPQRKTPTSDDEKAFEDDLDMSKFQTSVSIANGASSVQLKDVASIYNDSRVASPKPPSNSSDRSAALLSKRSISPANKVQKSKWASKRKLRHRNATARFDVCASDVQLDDPVFVRETGKSVETPVRLVLRIENGVSLIIMNQCHVHVDFKAYRQHLRLNLGVHVKVNDDLKSLDLVTTKRGPSPPDPNSECPPDMFAIYEQNSPSLQQLLLPRHELLSDDVYGTNAKKIVIKDDRQKSGTSAFPGTAKGVSGFPGTAKGVSGFPGTAKGVSGVPGTAKGVSGFPGTAKGVSTVVGTAKGVSELRRGTTNRVSGEFGTAAKPRYACPKVRQRRVQSEECVVYLAPQKKILDCDLKPGETVPKLPIKYVL